MAVAVAEEVLQQLPGTAVVPAGAGLYKAHQFLRSGGELSQRRGHLRAVLALRWNRGAGSRWRVQMESAGNGTTTTCRWLRAGSTCRWLRTAVLLPCRVFRTGGGSSTGVFWGKVGLGWACVPRRGLPHGMFADSVDWRVVQPRACAACRLMCVCGWQSRGQPLERRHAPGRLLEVAAQAGLRRMTRVLRCNSRLTRCGSRRPQHPGCCSDGLCTATESGNWWSKGSGRLHVGERK